MAGSPGLALIGGDNVLKATQAGNTVINALCQPRLNAFTRLTKIQYVCSTTAHVITIMRSIGRTTVAEEADAGQPVIVLTADPDSDDGIDDDDYIAIRESDGVTRIYQVDTDGVDGLEITLTDDLVAGCDGGESLWFFGATGDADPYTGNAHQALDAIASTLDIYKDQSGQNIGIARSNHVDEPLMIQSNNDTDAGIFEVVQWVHTLH